MSPSATLPIEVVLEQVGEGVILADAGDRPGVAIAEIEPSRIEQVRRQMPSLLHRVFV